MQLIGQSGFKDYPRNGSVNRGGEGFVVREQSNRVLDDGVRPLELAKLVACKQGYGSGEYSNEPVRPENWVIRIERPFAESAWNAHLECPSRAFL